MTKLLSQPKSQVSLSFGATLALITITVLTILDDKLLFVHTWLTNTFSHHWLGKSIIALVVFVLASVLIQLLPLKPNIKSVTASFTVLNIFTALCLLALVLFFGMSLVR